MIIAIPINILMNSNVVDHLNPSITDVELKIVEKIKIKYAVLSAKDMSENEVKNTNRIIFCTTKWNPANIL